LVNNLAKNKKEKNKEDIETGDGLLDYILSSNHERVDKSKNK
jgi:CRISPR/Cas system-associated protein Cas7 (RAMP superfamily)